MLEGTSMMSRVHLYMEIKVRQVPMHRDHNAPNAKAMDTLQQYVLQKKKKKR